MRPMTFTRCLVCALCAVFLFPSFSFASVSLSDEQKLAESARLLTQWRQDRSRAAQLLKKHNLSVEARLRRNEAIVVRKCLKKINRDMKEAPLAKEALSSRVDQCLASYKKAKNISLGVGLGGTAAAIALHYIFRTEWFFYFMISTDAPLSIAASEWIAAGIGAAGTVAYLCFRPLPAESGRVPGSYDFVSKLRADPDLFADDGLGARQALASFWNEDGSLSRYLDNYLHFLRHIRQEEFVLSLPDVQQEYDAWAKITGVPEKRPDMMKFMEIASRYPLSAREKQLRAMERERVLRAVTKTIKENALHPVPGL